MSRFFMTTRTENLVNAIIRDGGDNPLIFFDTSAILDFEREIALRKRLDPKLNASDWYSALNSIGPLFVSEGVLAEVSNHYAHCQRSGQREISCETQGLVTNMHQDYCTFLKNMFASSVELDRVRYDVYSASQIALKDNEKKRDIDPISFSDRETIATACWLVSSADASGKLITSARLVGHDGHLEQTIKVLSDQDQHLVEQFGTFGYSGIKFVDSR